MKKAVKIYVKGVQGGLADQNHQGEEDAVELNTEGVLYHQHGHTYVVYDDLLINDGDPVKTTVKVYEGKVDIKRYGSIEHHMTFEMGKDHYSHYETPFGVLDIAVKPLDMSVSEEDYALSIDISYTLDVNDASIGNAYFQMRTEKL